MYHLMHRSKCLGTFDYFHEAWVFAQLNVSGVSYIKDNFDELHVVIPPLEKRISLN